MKTSPPVVFVLGLMVLPFTAQAAITWGETITAGSTEIKADHINEIRAEISNLETQLDGAGQWADGTASAIYYNSGNVGIGDSTPAQKLEVGGSVRFTTTAPRLQFHETNTTDTNYEIYLNAGKLQVRSNNDAFDAASAKMTFDVAGNVGIGTSSPANKLTITAPGDVTAANAGGGVLIQDSDGASTGYKLRIDANEMQVANNGAASGLMVNPFGGKVAIGNSTSETDIQGNMEVGPQGSGSADRVIDARKNFSGDGNYYHMYTAGTVSGDPTANRSAFGGLFSLTNNRGTTTNGDRGYGYGVRGYITNSTGTQKTYYNAGGSFESRNVATAGISNLRGVSATAFQNATSGTADTLYAVEGNARGRASAGATSVIANARGTMGSVYPYNSNVTNAYGSYGYTATNNGYSGNIGSAFGARGDVNHDSDDGATMTNAYGGYFRTYKRGTAPNIGTTYGVYASAAGGGTNYGIYSAAGRNYFANRIGIKVTDAQASLHVNDTTDVSLTSTGHAATFGSHTGSNIALDGNEIMARNNGAEAPLYINNDGGDVVFHNAQASGTQVAIKDNGLVGIGTTSPAERLHVIGDARVSGDVQANRICDATGGNCKTNSQLGGGTTWNFANQSLRSDSYAYTGSGSSNIMLGHLAGNNSLTGSYNILMGLFAGFGQTSASYNLIMGQQAGRYTTTGGANVMMGSSSGNRNTTGYGNTFLGHITGDYNTTGHSNVMIGSSTGRVNTTGDNSVVIGANAKKSSATTNNEIVIGSNATGSGGNSVTIGGIGINKTVLKGNVGIGDDTPDTDLRLDVEGKIGATEYCDENGANCVASASLGGGSGVGHGGRGNPDLTITLNDGAQTTNWVCEDNIDLEDICFDGDGCNYRVFMNHKTHADDQVRVVGGEMYFEDPSFSNSNGTGIYGWVRQTGGGDYAVINGTGTRLDVLSNNWEWSYLLNYKHSHCPAHASHVPYPTSQPYRFSYITHPVVRTKVMFWD